MARFHWWSFLVNEEGQPIEGAHIDVYLAGTNEPAYVFEDEFSGAPNHTLPQVTSQENGYFEFWIPDVDEPSGYNPLQKFKIHWHKPGITEGWIDYIDVFPPTLPVNEMDDDETKIKTVSNALAYGWEKHRRDTSHVVHGIDEVDQTDIYNEEKNKLVSNTLAYYWQSHINGLADDESGEFPWELNPHGIKTLDISETYESPDDIYSYNRVISWYQGTKWDTHVDNKIVDTLTAPSSAEGWEPPPHNIEQVDETDSDITKNKLVSNELLRKLYYKVAPSKKFDIFMEDWFINENDNFQIDIEHNLEDEYPFVQTWDLNNKEMVVVENIQSVDSWNIKLVNNSKLNLKVIISS